jgi:hypothetical protein
VLSLLSKKGTLTMHPYDAHMLLPSLHSVVCEPHLL